MRFMFAALWRARVNALAPCVAAAMLAGLCSIEPVPARLGLVPPVLVSPAAALPAPIAAAAELQADAVDQAVDQVVDWPTVSEFVTPLPMPRPRPGARLALLAEGSKWVGAGARDLGVRRDLWCAAAINKMLRAIGLKGTGSDLAASFASWGRRLAGPAPGAIAVKHRRGGDHVVIVKAVLPGGDVLAISPNGGGRPSRVRLSRYPAAVFYAFVEPGA